MRAIWLIFGFLLAGLFGLRLLRQPATELAARHPAARLAAERRASPPGAERADSLVRFALRQLGTPYAYAGTSPLTGFDCSGFITYVFGHFGVATPHATALLIDTGRPVPRAQAQPGDIVVFTGTAEGSTTPGHAGIVISALGEIPLRFVHASSARRESGVKISQVENSGYAQRFLQVRRVLASAARQATPAARQAVASQPLAQPSGAVATLPISRPSLPVVAVKALPARVAPVASHPHAGLARASYATRQRVAASAARTKKRVPAAHRLPERKANRAQLAQPVAKPRLARPKLIGH